MAVTGDIANNMKKLQSELKKTRYGGEFNSDNFKLGIAGDYIPIYYHLLHTFSRVIAKKVVEYDMKPSLNSTKFIAILYRILRNVFDYKPVITREQFLQSGFAERKIIMCIEVIQLIYKVHNNPLHHSTVKKSDMPSLVLPSTITTLYYETPKPLNSKDSNVSGTVSTNEQGESRHLSSSYLNSSVASYLDTGSQYSAAGSCEGSRGHLRLPPTPNLNGVHNRDDNRQWEQRLKELETAVNELRISLEQTNKKLDDVYHQNISSPS